jgi:hypothetical protein
VLEMSDTSSPLLALGMSVPLLAKSADLPFRLEQILVAFDLY